MNGIDVITQWEFDAEIRDTQGKLAFGAIAYAPEQQSIAQITLNAYAMNDAEDLLRSTALHELGHAIFDVPSWIRQGECDNGAYRQRRFRIALSPERDRAKGAKQDWSEWRANEFMGAFLLPCPVLLRALENLRDLARPSRVCNAVATWPYSFGLLESLSITLGLSTSFILVRMRKYGLLDK